jgi:2-dehydro-3-deoxyphosphooctonate aldolase (KDO 8-P synthase)
MQVGPISINGGSLILIAGPCVIEDKAQTLKLATSIRDIAQRCKMPFVFKASYDKANRTSVNSFRGPGLDEGLRVLADVKSEIGVPILTDVHEPSQVNAVAKIADVLQIPAFLCRQTDLLTTAARTGRVVNIKKGQFMSPHDMRYAVEKVTSEGNSKVLVTERGTSFGYHNLVVDMRAFPILRTLGHPVIFDVTHSLQRPGAGNGVTSGQAEFIETLASAGVAAGVDGLFLEVHEEPTRAKSDAQNTLSLDQLEPLLVRLSRIAAAVQPRKPNQVSQSL